MRNHEIVAALGNGKTIKYRPTGNSMQPKIASRQLVTVEPLGDHVLKKGDIVFCKVKSHFYLHLVTAVQGNQVQISNNKGHVNGWITRNGVYGRCIQIAP